MKYVFFAPKGLKTGGPEGIHQLCWALNKLNQDARLLAWPKTKRSFAVNEYRKYEPKWCQLFEIKKSDIFIVTESIQSLPIWYFAFINRKRIYMWMHSVDFSLDKELNQYEKNNYKIKAEWDTEPIKDSKFKLVLRKTRFLKVYHLVKRSSNLFRKKILKSRITIAPENYIFASYYSLNTISRVKKSNSDVLLSGWVNGSGKKSIEHFEFCRCAKKHVTYNPAKSKELINKVIEINELNFSAIHFLPISGIKTDLEVYGLLASSDLYLDLGFFPGLERTPREAIKMGCPVLLAKRGAARFSEDFPLPKQYLLDLSLLGPFQTYETLLKILSLGKAYNLKNQKAFKNSVLNEKVTFMIEVERFIKKIKISNR